jgi:uncharacterized protein (DUF488 family)
VKVFTIGFTKSSAEDFFGRLAASGAQRVVDVRLNNTSQLAAFAKRDDLAYFLRTICAMEYVHVPVLCPTQDIIDEYRKGGGGWDRFAERYLDLLAEREAERHVDPAVLDRGCLLCSEHEPDHCHRRLAVEYLHDKWGDLEITHL